MNQHVQLLSLYTFCPIVFFFFFSSRRRHTRFDCDWSSDVCSSDLATNGGTADVMMVMVRTDRPDARRGAKGISTFIVPTRSEERRVGKECRSRWSPYH